MEEFPNATLSLVVNATIAYHIVLGILIDEEILYDDMYSGVFMRLRLRDRDLMPCSGFHHSPL